MSEKNYYCFAKKKFALSILTQLICPYISKKMKCISDFRSVSEDPWGLQANLKVFRNAIKESVSITSQKHLYY